MGDAKRNLKRMADERDKRLLFRLLDVKSMSRWHWTNETLLFFFLIKNFIFLFHIERLISLGGPAIRFPVDTIGIKPGDIDRTKKELPKTNKNPLAPLDQLTDNQLILKVVISSFRLQLSCVGIIDKVDLKVCQKPLPTWLSSIHHHF